MDEAKLNELLGKMVTELGAAFVGASVIIGDQLGLYKALAAHGFTTAQQLAERTGTTERCDKVGPPSHDSGLIHPLCYSI